MSYESLSHSRWSCTYHVVFVPKRRRKSLHGTIWTYLGPVFHELATQKECKIVEGHIVQAHVHMVLDIPPKPSVAQIIGYVKGKTAIAAGSEVCPRPGTARWS